MNLHIGMAKDALLFHQPQQTFYERVSSLFQKMLKDKFHGIIHQLQHQDATLYKNILHQQAQLIRIGALEKLWTAPELVCRILEYPFESAGQVGALYVKAAEAEIARESGIFDHNKSPWLWTLNGDYFIRHNQEENTFTDYNAFTLSDRTILDFFSPNCLRIDGQELEGDPACIIEEYNYEDAFHLYERLEEIVEPLNSFQNSATDLLTNFTSVIILKKQAGAKNTIFSSASLYPYIGRSLLVNAHHAHASQVIDGLVHEAIHSLLYIIDAVEKWMPSNATINKVGPVIVSPWTGRLLNPGNFCQALFVWYGLFNFWQMALQHDVYDKAYGESRLRTIQNGFRQVEIYQLNKKFNLQLTQTLMQTVEAVKSSLLKDAYAITTRTV